MTYEVGGQAVIEGVMMKSPSFYTVAARKEDGTIVIMKKKYVSAIKRHPFLNIPILRGVLYLYEMLVLGLTTLTWSANQQVEEQERLNSKEIVITLTISLIVSLLLFVGLPFLITIFLTANRGFYFNVIDGFFRLFIFLLYVVSIGLLPDIRRLYQYHGAEHKVVNCYELGKKLTVRNVRTCSVQHPRCGTSFIVLVIGLSIVVFSFITSQTWYLNLGARVLFIPLIAGISYELLKWSAKVRGHPIIRMFIYPGLLVQKLTTREPDSKQMEVSIAAMSTVLQLEGKYKK